MSVFITIVEVVVGGQPYSKDELYILELRMLRILPLLESQVKFSDLSFLESQVKFSQAWNTRRHMSITTCCRNKAISSGWSTIYKYKEYAHMVWE